MDLIGSILSYSSRVKPALISHLYASIPCLCLWNKGVAAYFDVNFQQIDDNLYQIRPKRQIPKQTLFYLHGGAYMWCDHSTHIVLLCQLSSYLNCTIFAYDYPVLSASENQRITVSDLIDLAVHTYLCLPLERSDDILVAGDSAGGALAINLVRRLVRDPKPLTPLPSRLILFSPWTNLHSPQLHPSSDDYLTPDLVKDWGNRVLRRGFHNESDVSPALITDFHSFPPMLVIYGRNEVLCTQISHFIRQVRQHSGSCDVAAFDDMPHVFPLIVPFGQTTSSAFQRIRSFCHSSQHS